MTADPQGQKDVIVTTLDAFETGIQDTIVKIPISDTHTLSVRITRVSDVHQELINTTDIAFTRALRDQFLRESEAGARSFRILELTDALQDEVAQYGKPELVLLYGRLWKLAADTDDATPPVIEPLDDIKAEVYRRLLLEQIVEIETQKVRGLMPRSILDYLEDTPHEKLTPEEQLDRIREREQQIIAEKRRLMRDLTLEELRRRIAYAAAMQPAAETAMRRRRCILLYACARQEHDRSKFLFDLTPDGITGVVDACKDPQKTYDAMVKRLDGDEALLQMIADRIAVDAGTLTEELGRAYEETARSPFLSDDLQPDGWSAGVGEGELAGDSVPGSSPGEEDKVLDSSEGADPAGDVDGFPKAIPVGD